MIVVRVDVFAHVQTFADRKLDRQLQLGPTSGHFLNETNTVGYVQMIDEQDSKRLEN